MTSRICAALVLVPVFACGADTSNPDPCKDQTRPVALVHPARAFFGEPFTITVCNDSTGIISEENRGNLRLYINDLEVPGLRPESIRTGEGNHTATFRIDWPSADTEADRSQRSALRPFAWGQPVTMSVNLKDRGPLPAPGDATNFRLRLGYHQRWGWLAFLIVFAAISWFSPKFIYDSPSQSDPAAQPRASLSRFQLLWWTMVTLVAVLFIWGRTGYLEANAQLAALIGIAGLTLVGSKQADSVRENNRREESLRQAQSAATAATTAAALAPTDPVAAGGFSSAAQAHASLARLAAARIHAPGGTGKILVDLLCDETGVSLQRLQFLLWTVVTGVYYVHQAFTTYELPVLDASILALIGISGGTFVVMKPSENR